jgi:hypothetical protein
VLLAVGDPASQSCARVFAAEVGEVGVLRVAIDEVAPRRVEVEIEGDIDGRTVRRSLVAHTCATALVAADVVVGTVRAAVGGSEPEVVVVEPAPVVPLPPEEPAPPPAAVALVPFPPFAALPPTAAPKSPLRARKRAKPRDLLVTVAAEGGISFGVLPRLGGDVGLRVGVGTQRWRGDLAASWLPLQRLDVDAGTAIVQSWSTELRALFVPRVTIVEFPLHVGVALGDVVATGVDVTAATTAHAFWGAALVGAGLTVVPVRRVGIGLDVSGTAAFSRPTFTFGRATGSVQVHQPDLIGVRALLRVEIRLP